MTKIDTYSKNNLPPHIMRHSPDGMNWGYGGSGPSDLALSLLTDVVGKQKAELLYQDFKFKFVVDFNDDWSISAEMIKDWVNAREK